MLGTLMPVAMDPELSKINVYFKSVIDMIPADFYFKSKQTENTNKKQRKGKKARSLELGPRAKTAIVKRRKFNPTEMKTTSERMTQVDDDDDHVVPTKKQKLKRTDEVEEAPSINALQKRLKEKIAEIQQKRNPKNRPEEELLQIRERRRKERKKFKLKKKMGLNHAAAEMQGLPGQKNARMDSDAAPSTTPMTNTKEPILNSQGKVVFSKFDFGEEPGQKKQKKKRKGEVPTGKNLKSLLAKAESKKEELENLKATNPNEAAGVLQKESWDKAMAKAEGAKVKDDPELLKKSIKKEKAIKKQKAKKWKERDENVQEKIQKRQEKRKKNIQARKDQMKDKKKNKRMKSFAKSIPGF